MKYSLLSAIALFAAAATAQTNNAIAVIDNRVRLLHEVSEPEGDADVNATAKVYRGDEDIDANRACQEQNTNYIPSLKAGQYSTSAFHNCFRTIQQIVEFTDALAAQNPTLLTRFAISKTNWNNTIYGYKLSKDKGHSQSLYFQSQQHAREWAAVSSVVFSLASILDDIANKKPTAADEYDLYFVPIVNVDGYIQSWKSGYRFLRRNPNGVDLNRNWPTPIENPEPPPKTEEIYPGPNAFSEPETAGINDWLKTKRDEIQGFLDIHSHGGLILYPYGDNNQTIGGGLDEKFQVLGRGLRSAMGEYKPGPSYTLYLSYGTFIDYVFREFKKPALTIEIFGSSFNVSASTIPARGLEMYKGINQFAKEVAVFNGGDVKPIKTSCGD
ncbi:hypothetical protein DYB25_011683 [Aphanomyces astaci]|uniref:Peptidase M14 domain-containing protein n=2 Tax=Aphanomyces astaci TaxID=112090 RepID=A0A397B9B5_APHAT|nr:hypothetical protein DYB25_011683 [Aphanomyces astaci]